MNLKTQDGKFLRANGNNPPYRDSVTHDIPWVGQDLILWDVEVVENMPEQLPQPKLDDQLESLKSRSSSGSNHQRMSHSFIRQEVSMLVSTKFYDELEGFHWEKKYDIKFVNFLINSLQYFVICPLTPHIITYSCLVQFCSL